MSSARYPELQALDRLFGIKGAQAKVEPRELKQDETVTGEIVAQFRDNAGQENYLIETNTGEMIVVPKDVSSDLSKGDEIEATRTSQGHALELDDGFER